MGICANGSRRLTEPHDAPYDASMAATKKNRSKEGDPLCEETRGKIKTTQLRKRLEQFVLGEKDEAEQKVEMSPQQVRAALGLLKKTIPDLSTVSLIGDAEQPVETRSELKVIFVDEKEKTK